MIPKVCFKRVQRFSVFDFNIQAIIQYTFFFVLYVHNFKICFTKKTILNEISVLSQKDLPRTVFSLLCNVITISFVILTAVIPLTKLSKDKASLKKSLWHPMKLQLVQYNWLVELINIFSLWLKIWAVTYPPSTLRRVNLKTQVYFYDVAYRPH